MDYKYSPYSFSKISCFSCPAKFNLKYILKVRTPQENDSIYSRMGSYKHDVLEAFPAKLNEQHYLKYALTLEERNKCDDDLEIFLTHKYKNRFMDPESIGSEIELALSTSLKISTFWDKDCLFRGKIDRLNKLSPTVLNAIDWKSGRYREGGDQLKYYAAYCLLKYPEIKTVICSFVYIDALKKYEQAFTRADLKETFTLMFKKIKKIERARLFKTNPSSLCKYCEYYKSGDCQPGL